MFYVALMMKKFKLQKKQPKKKKASQRQVPDEVEPDFDIFSEEACRKSTSLSAV